MRKTFVLAVAVVALTGCGMLPPTTGGGGQEKQGGTQAAQTENAPPETTAPPAEQQTAPPQGDKVIASRETKAEGTDGATKVRVEITGLLRQGKTATLNWTITGLEGSFNVHNGMGGGVFDYSVSGVSLIDPVNAKRYRVARNGTDDKAECVCSGTQGEFLEKDESASLYAVFAAPPADVTKVNIEMPQIGVFTDVPIS
ncbi:lipoprotein [Nonomuraea sp. C10]|uniref:lipoprotein n=1 Tax=Nonomuraea sp. C10 TaxID=2600577 RepID=UPI0011CD5805|nr:lipoprotein [Nonomuraea sp. C10]TXK43367.1 hypothetical protein FR742_30690 [Nonomuraea sp. C10]